MIRPVIISQRVGMKCVLYISNTAATVSKLEGRPPQQTQVKTPGGEKSTALCVSV